jgi:hypothetical protein
MKNQRLLIVITVFNLIANRKLSTVLCHLQRSVESNYEVRAVASD